MKSILIVDDAEADQYFNSHIIEDARPSVTIMKAYNGEEALEIIKKGNKTPDLILLDINMPRMNGHEFLEAYTKLKGNQEIPVVVMLTSSDNEVEMRQTSQYPCVKKFLTKPLTEENVAVLENLVEATLKKVANSL